MSSKSLNASVASLDARRTEKKKAKRRGRLVRLAWIGVFLVVVAGGVALALSPLFSLQEVSVVVEGEDKTLETSLNLEVEQVVSPYYGTALLTLPLSQFKEELLDSAAVADVKISRSFPGELLVVVEPRVAVFMQADGDEVILLGSDGVVVGRAPEATGLIPVQLPISGRSAPPNSAQVAALVWESLPGPVREQTELISVEGTLVNIVLAGDRTVFWGSDQDSAVKGQVLEILLQGPPASAYDVSDPSRPSSR